MKADRISQVLARAWRSAVIVAILGAVVAFAVTTVAPRTYTGSAEVLLTPVAGVPASDAVDERLLASYAVLLGGRTIATAVRDDTGSGQSVNAIEDALHAEVVKGSSVLRVTARHSDARTAATLSRSAAQSLVNLLVDRGVALETAAGGDEKPTAAVVASVVDQSAVASGPTSPSIPWWIAFGTMLGFLLGLIVSAMRQLTDRLIRTPEELAEVSKAPVLGAIGYDRHTQRRPLVSDLDMDDPRFEATRILRTNLQFLDVDSTETVLTITSCLPAEGKSTLAANLAISLAHGGESVVLVDADLRRPRLDQLFDLSRSPGLTTALVGAVDLAEAVQTTSVPGLDVLTTGDLPPNPSELLQTNAMADLVLALKHRYDVVLFDAPPLLPVTDAALLTTLSDGAVLLVRHGRTTNEQVRAAIGRLESVGGPLLGVVLTMVPARGLARYGYGYGDSDGPRRPARPAPGRRSTSS